MKDKSNNAAVSLCHSTECDFWIAFSHLAVEFLYFHNFQNITSRQWHQWENKMGCSKC